MSDKFTKMVRSHAVGMLDRYPGNNGWVNRHQLATLSPRPGGERAIWSLILAIAALCDAHDTPYSDIQLGEDGYFNEHASALVKAALAYLNFDCGRFDCGTLDRLIRAIAPEAKIDIRWE